MFEKSFERIMIFRDLKSRSFMANIIPLLQSFLILKETSIYSVDEVPEKSIILFVKKCISLRQEVFVSQQMIILCIKVYIKDLILEK